jgi:hypothetical protein
MNRILKRPMFRKGGMPNEGIMSGLIEPRQNFFSGGITPGSILTPGGGVMTPNVSSPIGGRSIFYPPVTTTAAGVPATIPPPISPISPSSPRSVPFMERAGQLTRYGLGTLFKGAILPAAFSGPAVLAYSNRPKTLEELLVMKEQGPLDETMSEEDLAAYETRRAEARKDGTPIGKDDTGLLSTIEEIKKTIRQEGSSYDEAGIKPPPPPKKDDGLGEMGTSNFEKSLNEYLPAIESALKIDDEATKRQLYLQLAKFGAGLAAQPGGDLAGAIGRAAQKPLEGVSEILSEKQAAKRQAKLIAVQAAVKDLGPGSYGKNVEDIMKTFALKGTEGRKQAGAIYNRILSNDSTALSRDQEDLKKVAREDLRLEGGATDAYVENVRYMRENYPELIGKFNKVAQPGDKYTDKEYYVTPEGAFVRYREETDDFILPGEPGFKDIKNKK